MQLFPMIILHIHYVKIISILLSDHGREPGPRHQQHQFVLATRYQCEQEGHSGENVLQILMMVEVYCMPVICFFLLPGILYIQ